MASHHYSQIPLWTALVTPFTAEGQVDFTSLAQLVRRQVAAGNGILTLGSTGESLALSDKERCDVLRCVIEHATEVPVMVGVGGFQLQRQIAWCQQAAMLGAGAFLMLTPMYAKPGIHGQVQWFRQLMDAVQQPCMLYNIPARTGISLHAHSVQLLSEHPRFWAIKDSSADPLVAQHYQQMHPGAALYCGDDVLMAAYARHGACGCVSVASNLWPQASKHYVRQCLNDSLSDDVDAQWQARSQALFVTSNPVPIKAALKAQQFIASDYVRPPLHNADMPTLPAILRQPDTHTKS